MVDLLCERGNPTAAAGWRSSGTALRDGGRSLLCGYRIDVFDRDAQISVLPRSAAPTPTCFLRDDPERLERAVDAALEEALGAQAGQVYAVLGDQLRRKQVPPAQLALMWVSSQMPRSAERILESARAHYLQEPEPSRRTRYGSGLTTIALPAPRRTGSAAASRPPPPRNSIPVAAPISAIELKTCPRACSAAASGNRDEGRFRRRLPIHRDSAG